MSDNPDISVVMSVYNGARYLRETIESVLIQDGVSLEFIIINDGSIDASGAILNEYANRDRRIRVFHQENQGLTRALIRGCAAAHGQYIARQDVGDISLPNRFAKQLRCIRETQDAVLVSCGTRFVGPEGEFLYQIQHDPVDATTRLRVLDLNEIRGPSIHGSTLFAKAMYDQVGGYRPEFYFAQDLDLWIRLAEQGQHIVMPEVLYQASITVGAISGLYRKEQIETASIIMECARLRREDRSERPALERAGNIRPSAKRESRLGQARTLYFIGTCLRNSKNSQAQIYFKQALRMFPLHLKSAIRLLIG